MPKRIVVLDDDDLLLELLRDLLGLEGFAVDTFSDVSQAWQALHGTSPNGIFLDLRLGDQPDGWLLLRRMKADPVLSTLSVVICTADKAG